MHDGVRRMYVRVAPGMTTTTTTTTTSTSTSTSTTTSTTTSPLSTTSSTTTTPTTTTSTSTASPTPEGYPVNIVRYTGLKLRGHLGDRLLGDTPCEDTRMADRDEVWRKRGGIRPGQHFAWGDILVQYSLDVSCHVIASCVPQSRVGYNI